jgi:hypothetical protein
MPQQFKPHISRGNFQGKKIDTEKTRTDHVARAGQERNRQTTVLVDHLQSELENSRIKGVGHLSKITRPEAGADTLTRTWSALTRPSKLGVVPGVEALGTEFNPAAARFAEHELLEQ